MKKIGIVLILVSFLWGCADNTGVMANMQMKAATYLNPDISGQAAPLMVTFYELKSPLDFKSANYFSLSSNAASVLQNNLIDKHTLEIRPGEQVNYKISLPPSVRYVGIVAGYRNIDQAKWKRLVAVAPNSKRIQIQINLMSQELSVAVSKNKEHWL